VRGGAQQKVSTGEGKGRESERRHMLMERPHMLMQNIECVYKKG